MTRGEFIFGSGAFAALGGCVGFSRGDKPVLRVGIVTDTHVGKTDESCARVRLAYRLFRDLGVDLIHNNGDVADAHYPMGYAAYRRMMDEVFADVPVVRRPKFTFTYAAHDAFFYNGSTVRSDYARNWPAAFADMRRLLGANDPWTAFELKGYAFVIVPQFLRMEGKDPEEAGARYYDHYEKAVAEACAKHPDEPVFLFCHVPPAFTTASAGCDHRYYEILSKHPQVVNIAGHTHGSLADERNIWQGTFTNVNCGCLQNWSPKNILCGFETGNQPRIENYGAVVMEVFGNRIVFRRFDVRDGSECAADDPWRVPLPFDPEFAPYRDEARAAREVAPQFASGAKAEIAFTHGENPMVEVAFPHTEGVPRAMRYKVELEVLRHGWGGAKERFLRKDDLGDFWRTAAERRMEPRAKVLFPAAHLGRRSECRVTVTPDGFFGAVGRPISGNFTTPME